MIARTMFVKGDTYETGVDCAQQSSQPSEIRTRVHYQEERQEPDALYSAQHNNAKVAVAEMLQTARDNGLPREYWKCLRTPVYGNIDSFRATFLSGSHACFPPLHIQLLSESAPVKYRLRNYSAKQKKFRKDMKTKLVNTGVAYPNPTAKWASALLIWPKWGRTKYWFTVKIVSSKLLYSMPPLPNDHSRQ